MPKFKITTSTLAAYYKTYEVEAETEEEAKRLVLEGEEEATHGAYRQCGTSEEIEDSYKL